jgi:hypothetical protein
MPRFHFVHLIAATLVAGCATPEAPPAAPVSAPVPPATPGDTPAPSTATDRAAAAGLSDAQAAVLADLGVPVAVPGRLPAGWRVDGVDAQAGEYPEYTIRYAGPDGACFAVTAGTEGLGDRFVIAPPEQRDVDVPGLATYGPVPFGWSEADDAGDWGPMRAGTEWFGTDGVAYAVDSPAGDGCERAAIADLTAVIGSMRMLDARDDGPTGVWALADVPGTAAPSPEAAARNVAGPDEEGGRTTAEVLNARERHAVVIVTRTGLADDSVRDERLRVTTVREGRSWTVAFVVRQVRCHEGRGHADWSAELCV